ncbi:FecR family protein [Paenibacillus radicis (ex Xue et al. 2023)]|uniref:FecR domain-containing protein n=1 Tax=Paenibacillus radicis (ex Xue et al. 2023) TaxID=2972489 RepID=A0ABT1YDW5_9BACL|nr:FecR family protein [Paenibacillus radicis (ex Xue et al. 2023)]MCR8631122.1 FecR domain-containing protein [Paenibacillus radicis (ex Xue et al. 2023)]
MGHSKRMRMGEKKSFLSLFVAFCMVFSLLSTALAKPAEAKSTRAAIIVAANGTVSVKKAGGSKSYTAYKDMSLNEGDVIITGASSSAVLKIADHEDEITISENAEISIAELSEQGAGKTSKIKSWAGSLWVKVKSLVSSEDEFEVETPTAVMGVRGTQLGVSINPETGIMTVFLAAGKIDASTTTNNGQDGTQQTTNTILLPSQQLNLDSRDEVKDLDFKVDIIDINTFVQTASPEVIKALILNKSLIDQENQQFIAAKKKEIEENGNSNTGESSLTIKDTAELDKVAKNLDNLIGNIALAALAQNKITPDAMKAIISDANNQINDATKKLDLDKVAPLDKTAGVDSEKEKLKKAELEKLNAKKQAELEARLKLEKEKLEKLKAILESMEKEKKRIEEENKKAIEEAKQKAEAEYTSKQAEKENSSSNETTTTTPSSPSPSPGGSSSRPSNTVVQPPVLISPTAVTTNTTGSVEVKLTAAANYNIQILNGETIVSTLGGKGDAQTIFALPLPNGVYNLTARAEFGGRYSTLVAIPTVTVQIADNIVQPPALVSPTAVTTNTTGSVEVKLTAAANYNIQILNGETIVSTLGGKGDAQTIFALPLPNGVYNLTARAEFGGRYSTLVAIPTVTVQIADNIVQPPALVSPTAVTTNTTGNVEVKLTAAANSNIQILNGETIVSTLVGKGDAPSVFTLTLPDGVYNLTARAEIGGRLSASITIPTITVQITDITLTQVSKDANTVTLQLSMKNFLSDKEFYAIQAHLVYNNTLSYKGPIELEDVPNTVFDGADKSAETLKQHNVSTQSELVYAASQFEATNSTAEVKNITVVGTKALVSIPLTFSPNATGPTNVDLIYVKVVNKNGATVAEFTTPKSITVTK